MNNNSRTSAYGFGFTLIELLVVIAIIALLAAILFPVFASVREKARQATCESNEKQLALGVLQYVQDFDELYPSGINNSNYPSGWAGQIYTYVKSTGVYHCPDDPTGVNTSHKSYQPLSYVMNFNVANVAGTNPSLGATSGKLNAPAKTVLFVEIQGCQTDMAGLTGVETTSETTTGDQPYSMCTGGGDGSYGSSTLVTGAMRYGTGNSNPIGTSLGDNLGPLGIHSNGSNVAFTDGHVKWTLGTSLSPGQNNNVSSTDCTSDQGWSPVGTAGAYYAAGASCGDSTMVGTFSVN